MTDSPHERAINATADAEMRRMFGDNWKDRRAPSEGWVAPQDRTKRNAERIVAAYLRALADDDEAALQLDAVIDKWSGHPMAILRHLAQQAEADE